MSASLSNVVVAQSDSDPVTDVIVDKGKEVVTDTVTSTAQAAKDHALSWLERTDGMSAEGVLAVTFVGILLIVFASKIVSAAMKSVFVAAIGTGLVALWLYQTGVLFGPS